MADYLILGWYSSIDSTKKSYKPMLDRNSTGIAIRMNDSCESGLQPKYECNVHFSVRCCQHRNHICNLSFVNGKNQAKR